MSSVSYFSYRFTWVIFFTQSITVAVLLPVVLPSTLKHIFFTSQRRGCTCWLTAPSLKACLLVIRKEEIQKYWSVWQLLVNFFFLILQPRLKVEKIVSFNQAWNHTLGLNMCKEYVNRATNLFCLHNLHPLMLQLHRYCTHWDRNASAIQLQLI